MSHQTRAFVAAAALLFSASCGSGTKQPEALSTTRSSVPEEAIGHQYGIAALGRPSADANLRLLGEVELPASARQLWESASRREFNVGVQGGIQPRPFAIVLEPETLQACRRVNASLVIAVYRPVEKPRRDGRWNGGARYSHAGERPNGFAASLADDARSVGRSLRCVLSRVGALLVCRIG